MHGVQALAISGACLRPEHLTVANKTAGGGGHLHQAHTDDAMQTKRSAIAIP